MVLIGELFFYVGCMGLSAFVTRITILRCCLNREEELQSSPEDNGYTLMEDVDTPIRTSSSESPALVDLFSPRYKPVFRNNFEVSYYSIMPPVDARSPPGKIRSQMEPLDLDESFVINFEPFYDDDDSEEEEEKEEEEEEEDEEEEDLEMENQRELTPALNLDAFKFEEYDANIYYVKEFYYSLARERFANNIR